MFIPTNGGLEKMRKACIAKHNSRCEHKVMITGGEKWLYTAIKNISRLIHRITSKHDGDYHCLNCSSSFRTESRLRSTESIRYDNNF